MALDRSKVLDTAQKHLAKGNYDKAIAEYNKLVQADPNDVRTLLKVGDLYTRKGARKDACDIYMRVAKHYANQGFFLKAVAVYKQILKLEPNMLDVQLQLAEMYEHLQLASDALGTYEQVAAAYARQGNVEKALETLSRMCELDPDNIPVRIKYAEGLSKAGRTEDAASAFEQGAKLLKEQGRYDDYVKVAERLLYHRPDDTDVAEELAGLYLERRDPKRALTKLQLCFKADPHNVDTLEKLAQAFHMLEQTPKTISVYKEIARLHQEAGRKDERIRILKKIQELDPTDTEVQNALAEYAPSRPASASQAEQPGSDVGGPPPSAVIDSRAGQAPQPAGSEAATSAAGAAPAAAAGPAAGAQATAAAEPAAAEPVAAEPAAEARGEPTAHDEPELIEDDDAEFVDSAELLDADEGDVVILDEDEQASAAEEQEQEQPQSAAQSESAAHERATSPPDAAAEQPPSEDASVARREAAAQQQAASEGEAAAQAQADQHPSAEQHSKQQGSPSLPPDVAREAQIARLLTECDVFLRYGLKDKVVGQLHRVLEIDPTHVEARERLKDTCLEQGRTDEAIEQLQALANLFEDSKPQLAHLYRKQVLELDPNHAGARAQVHGSAAAQDTASVQAPEEQQTPAEDDDVLFFDDEEEQPQAASAGSEQGIDVVVDEGSVPPAAPQGEPTAPPGTPEQPPAAAAQEGSEAHPEQAEQAAAGGAPGLAPMTPQEFEAAPVRPSSPGEEAAAAQRASQPPGELEEGLDEAEFFMAQGLWDEARNSVEEMLQSHPDHPLLLDKLQEIEDARGGQPVPGAAGSVPPPAPEADAPAAGDTSQTASPEHAAAGPPAAGQPPEQGVEDTGEDQSFVLAEKLAEELGPETPEGEEGSEQIDVETIFEQFKRGVEETVSNEDVETHFDLGIAYKEMGLLDDSIEEFKLCVDEPSRECIAHTMIGLCYIEKSRLDDAIAHFKKGLYANQKSDREELGLYFELGRAYEMLEDAQEALYYYEKVQKREPGFRNVEDRIQALTEPQSSDNQGEDPNLGADDIDRAFDDLMRED